jgi:hypothetical protein
MRKVLLACLAIVIAVVCVSADAVNTNVPTGWTALVTTSWLTALGNQTDNYGGVSCVRVNRLTGDLLIFASGYGVWKSSNKGSTYTRLDGTTSSGRCENGGGAMQVDQNDPTRIAVFALDGMGGYTADGTTWTKLYPCNAASGRGWDFGSVDWATPAAKVMFAASHETGGKNCLSTDGGNTWTILGEGFGQNANSSNTCMVGVMDATTIIYGKGSGIRRSTNLGQSFGDVSTENSNIRVPVLFGGKHYLGNTKLLVSSDKGATWATQGTALPNSDKMYNGPWFGADANTMVVEGGSNFYKTVNGGTSWTAISTRPDNGNFYSLNPNWFGSGCWDPINNVLYATAMNNLGFKKELGGVSVIEQLAAKSNANGLTVNNSVIHSTVLFNAVELFRLNGSLVYQQHLVPSLTARIPSMNEPLICKITTAQGTTQQLIK